MPTGDEVVDADAAIVEGHNPPSKRKPLDRELIISSAVDYIDDQGLPGLTMRQLGQSLGVEAMALYRYVAGKDELLDGVVDHLIDTLKADDEVLDAPRDGWQDFLQRLAHGIRRLALEHPKAFPIIASRPPEAPWLRPPLRSLDWVEIFIAGLKAEGFSDDTAVAAYRAFTSFLLGNLLLEVSTLGADIGPLDLVEEDPDPDGLAEYPNVARLRRQLSVDHSAVEFEEALEELLNRLALMRQASSPSG